MFYSLHDTVRETCEHGCFNSWGRDRFWCYQQSHGPASHESGNVKLDARNMVIIRKNRFEDPLFVDYEKKDYRLKEESPAFKLEFEAFDMGEVELRRTLTRK